MKDYGLVLAVGLLFVLPLAGPARGQEEGTLQPSDSKAAVIRIESGSAAETAHILDEIYNGARGAQKARVVAFAVPMTNCLFVMATNTDLQAIRELLRPL